MGFIVLVAFLSLPIFFIKGATWFSYLIEPLILLILLLAFTSMFLVGLPLTLMKKTKFTGAQIMFFTSYIFGLILWIICFMYSLMFFGPFITFIGLAFVGIGVLPIAIVGFILNGYWTHLLILAILALITYGSRIYVFALEEDF